MTVGMDFMNSGGSDIDFTNPTPNSAIINASASSNFTFSVTAKPKYILYNVLLLLSSTYSFTYLIDVENEKASRIGFATGGSVYFDTLTYSNIVVSIPSGAGTVTLKNENTAAASIYVGVYY